MRGRYDEHIWGYSLYNTRVNTVRYCPASHSHFSYIFCCTCGLHSSCQHGENHLHGKAHQGLHQLQVQGRMGCVIHTMKTMLCVYFRNKLGLLLTSYLVFYAFMAAWFSIHIYVMTYHLPDRDNVFQENGIFLGEPRTFRFMVQGQSKYLHLIYSRFNPIKSYILNHCT